jgi:outer membrane receptor protein involved in Fe transport
VRIQGLEAGLRYESQGWRAEGSMSAVTYLKEKNSGHWLPDLPPMAARATLGLALPRGDVSLTARGSSGYDAISRTRAGQPRVWVGPYVLLSANAYWWFSNNVRFFASGDNLLNQAWQSTLDVPGAGFTARGGMELNL